MATQAINQLDLVKANSELIVIVINISSEAGVRRNIRVRRSRTPE